MKILTTEDVFITDADADLFRHLNDALATLARIPAGRERSLVATKIEEALFWARQRAWKSESHGGPNPPAPSAAGTDDARPKPPIRPGGTGIPKWP